MPSRPDDTSVPEQPDATPQTTPVDSGVLPPIIPEDSVNLLAGAPGAGKTTLVSTMARWFRDGEPIFGFQPRPVPFQGFISADRSWKKSTHKWFVAAGFGDIPAYSLQDDLAFNTTRLRKKQDRVRILDECLDQLTPVGEPIPPGSVIWVDPLSLFLGGNLLDYDTCLVACTEIRRICTARHITLIGTAHAGKQKADSAQRYLRIQDRIAGSVALFGYTDTQMYLAEPAEVDEDFYLFHWHPHHAKPGNFPLQRRDSDGLFEPYDTHQLAIAAQCILEIVPITPGLITLKELVRTLVESGQGISRAAVHRHLAELTQLQTVIKVGHGKYTRPKPQ